MHEVSSKIPTILLTWTAVWPFVTLLLLLADDLLGDLPLPFRTLVVTAVMVPVMVLSVAPIVAKLSVRLFGPKPSDQD